MRGNRFWPVSATRARGIVAGRAKLEGALRYTGKALGVQTLQALAVLYPFTFDQPLAYLVANSPTLEVQADGSGNLCVALN